jgi:hypothetical protein
MVSVVDCGSKHNLPLYVTIAEAFQLHYQVVHDEDPLPATFPGDWSQDKIRAKKETFALNRTIADAIGRRGMVMVCQPDCEELCGVSHTQGKRKGKALAALDHFAELGVEAYPQDLVTIVQQAYQLNGAEA